MFVYILCINEYGSLSSSNAALQYKNIASNVKIYANFLEKSTNNETRDIHFQSQQIIFSTNLQRVRVE